MTSIKSVLPSKAGLPTEEENPRWLGTGERVSSAPMRWSIGSTGKQNLPWCVYGNAHMTKTKPAALAALPEDCALSLRTHPELPDLYAVKLRTAFEHTVSAGTTRIIFFRNPRAPSLLMTRNPAQLPQVVPVLLAGTAAGGAEANTALGLELGKLGGPWLPLFQGMTGQDGFYGIMLPYLFYRAPQRGTFRQAAEGACRKLGESGLITGWCLVHCGVSYLTKDGRFHEAKDYPRALWRDVEEAQPWVN